MKSSARELSLVCRMRCCLALAGVVFVVALGVVVDVVTVTSAAVVAMLMLLLLLLPVPATVGSWLVTRLVVGELVASVVDDEDSDELVVEAV